MSHSARFPRSGAARGEAQGYAADPAAGDERQTEAGDFLQGMAIRRKAGSGRHQRGQADGVGGG